MHLGLCESHKGGCMRSGVGQVHKARKLLCHRRVTSISVISPPMVSTSTMNSVALPTHSCLSVSPTIRRVWLPSGGTPQEISMPSHHMFVITGQVRHIQLGIRYATHSIKPDPSLSNVSNTPLPNAHTHYSLRYTSHP